jgi:hypothetical protein
MDKVKPLSDNGFEVPHFKALCPLTGKKVVTKPLKLP